MQGNNMVNPEGMDVLSWADTIFVDFPTDDIPILTDATLWKTWGNNLVICNTFTNNNAPDTHDYDNWLSWAEQVYFTMANYA